MWKNSALIEDVEIEMDEPVFPTGVVCRLIDIPLWVVKELDREGIVSPPRKRGGDRLYSRQDLNQLNYVWTLMQKRQITMGHIRVVLEIQDEAGSRRK
jgi:DNA-binding transcriptional MerR regulator